MLKVFNSLARVQYQIVHGYVPKRSPFDKTQYIENFIPRQLPFPKSRRPKLSEWEDENVNWPVLQPSPVISRLQLMKDIEQEEMKRLQIVKPIEFPDFRVGDVIEFKWVHNMSEPNANVYQGLVVARRNRNSLEASFKIIFRHCGSELFMYVKQNSPYLREFKILKKGSGNLRNKEAIWRHSLTKHQLLQPMINRSVKKRSDDPIKRMQGKGQKIAMSQEKDESL